MRESARCIVLVAAMLATGCVSTHRGTEWGAVATFTPGFDVVKTAFRRAATDPLTWTPIAGAGLLIASGVDGDWSDAIVDAAPLFGGDADDASNDLRDIGLASYLVTALVAPGGDTFGEWLAIKARGLQVGVATFGAEGLATTGLKSAVGRDRPNGESDKSFPSGHAAHAGAAATLAARNLAYVEWPAWGRRTATWGVYGVAAVSGWARVEAEKHYLSDALVGFAIGHFFARFMHEAFLEAGVGDVEVTAQRAEGGFVVSFAVPLGR